MIIKINTQSPTPIYEQLRNQIVLGIACKALSPGEALPSIRGLAADLGINYLTVNKAYSLLCDEGYIVIDRRKGAMAAQTIGRDEQTAKKLSGKLTLLAAEALCKNIDKDDFIALCADAYSAAKGDKNHGGTL